MGSFGKRIYRRLSLVPVWLLLTVVAIFSLPTVNLFVESFRGGRAGPQGGFWTVANDPEQLTLKNYSTVLNRTSVDSLTDSLISSFAIAIPATVFPLAFAGLAAYGFAFIGFKGREWLFIGTITLMALPFQMALIPLLTTFVNGAHLTLPFTERTLTVVPDLNMNTRGTMAVWLAQTGFALPFAIFLLHNAFTQLPKALLESARVDGANHLTVFTRLVVPLALPAFLSLAILQFLWSWNEFLIARTMTSGGDPVNLPATVRLADLVGEIGSAGPVGAAAVFVQAAVPLAVFVVLQRHIVRGLLTGSVNG